MVLSGRNVVVLSVDDAERIIGAIDILLDAASVGKTSDQRFAAREHALDRLHRSAVYAPVEDLRRVVKAIRRDENEVE